MANLIGIGSYSQAAAGTGLLGRVLGALGADVAFQPQYMPDYGGGGSGGQTRTAEDVGWGTQSAPPPQSSFTQFFAPKQSAPPQQRAQFFAPKQQTETAPSTIGPSTAPESTDDGLLAQPGERYGEDDGGQKTMWIVGGLLAAAVVVVGAVYLVRKSRR